MRVREAFVCVNDHTLLRAGLAEGARVIDIGANHGGFQDALSRIIPDGSFHAIEANEALIEGLRQRYRSVCHLAVTGNDGPVKFHVAADDEASSLLPLTNSTVSSTVIDVDMPGRSMETILHDVPGSLDVVKVDIEGAETDALLSLSPQTLRRVGQLSVEFHHADTVCFDLKRSSKQAIAHVRRHGFIVFRFRERDMDVLFVNRSRFQVTWMQQARWQFSLTTLRWGRRLSSLRQKGVVCTLTHRLSARLSSQRKL
jgi:FkbM family methyltransferase